LISLCSDVQIYGQFVRKQPQYSTFEVLKVLCNDSVYGKRQIDPYKEVTFMAVHHGGKVGGAAKTLASKGSSKPAKSKAGKTLANHKAKSH
jgi:hypothetical protein